MEVNIVPQIISEAAVEKSSTAPSSSSNVTTIPVPAALIDTTFSSSTNLTTTVLGAKILSFSDEYFASAENLLTQGPPIRKPGYFVHTGAWYDGWETRRHNSKEYDWVVIKLGCVGTIDAVEVDTAHFNGNEAPFAGLDGCFLGPDQEGEVPVDKEEFQGWTEVLPRSKCGPSQRQAWKVSGPGVTGKEFTHLRLKQYPDGGIARLRVYGSVKPPPLPASATSGERPVEDLAAALNGGVAIECSDQHFGGKSYLLLPGRGKDMGDGWETARSRTKGHEDWVIVRLGLKGKRIEKVIVDTKDFRGNFPRAVKVEGWSTEVGKAALGTESDPTVHHAGWVPLILGEQPCKADTEHVFEGGDLVATDAPDGHVWTHAKMTIIPDGGVKRLRIFGKRA
ncbi:Allantoicase [Elasticomyces elasticus]|uniref:Allantoicase n=1 Tax=Exophiala sideris TaxID=1016849 RepID=A0ABR0JKY0_9EURO|nr:Allantoicase [Elasticomyces elasticus]KAK5035514.1 Allantoicase [Exophiala sideris]KAK5039134.1 Allantoicase [Exophiala sideris]KAK5066439.1 Allantoicase [Exophiala sideris]KAK5187116.1 Allantoicase [Eurotiomycetes sp. CCFEE 6388]